MTTPSSTWRMPSETAEQERVYMAFPPKGESFGTSDEEARSARETWTAVAHAIAEFVPVTMLVDPADSQVARQLLSRSVERVEAALDDAWMRDMGPTFVLDGDNRLGAVAWQFNGWGQQEWARWENDQHVGKLVAEHAGAETISSDLVNEGGGINVDGLGTVLLTDTVQLDRFRNPGWSRDRIEAEFARTIGAERCIWFPRGLHRDTKRFGTRGHIDIVATIPQPDTVLLHRQENPEHPDFHLNEIYDEVVAGSTTAAGAAWKVLDLPAPVQLRDDAGWVDYSYVNHLVTNGAVIACTFDDPNDARALEALGEVYPGRRIVGVDARNIFRYGGGIHCITQQQPRSAATK
ncbi:agmatine/peptidylarginine deiminase [Streptomyces sp. NPDC056255]|uniref:agmatine deiminase family protein n=1 Tax=Streptomyces sp. NPDC056255 TaxID=3345764 RepID=UPI0035D79CEE